MLTLIDGHFYRPVENSRSIFSITPNELKVILQSRNTISGNFWRDHASIPQKFKKFKSDMGHRLTIATENGATYELHSNTPIPKHVKEFLNKKGIKYFEY